MLLSHLAHLPIMEKEHCVAVKSKTTYHIMFVFACDVASGSKQVCVNISSTSGWRSTEI